jgi:hypothetical protein
MKFVSKNDHKYLVMLYKHFFGYIPDIENPQTYNEKLLWLKLYWRDERCYKIADKYEVRGYVGDAGLGDILIPLYGVYNSVEEIRLDELPKEFIIKTTHDSGGTYIVKDKTNCMQIRNAVKHIKRSLKNGVYNRTKEWVYDKITPRIIVEQLLHDDLNESIIDYKIFCFNGKAKFLYVATDRSTDVKFDFFDLDWNWMNLTNGHNNNVNHPKKPRNFDRMIEIAEILSSNFPHVRVDLYNLDGKIFFGEMTFFHFGGIVKFVPRTFDYDFGKYIEIDKISTPKK